MPTHTHPGVPGAGTQPAGRGCCFPPCFQPASLPRVLEPSWRGSAPARPTGLTSLTPLSQPETPWGQVPSRGGLGGAPEKSGNREGRARPWERVPGKHHHPLPSPRSGSGTGLGGDRGWGRPRPRPPPPCAPRRRRWSRGGTEPGRARARRAGRGAGVRGEREGAERGEE